MNNEELKKIIREYVDKSIHMSLATTKGDHPWVCEVHFVYDDDLNLYWRSLQSRRHSQEIAKNPNVAGNIVGQHGVGEYPHAVYFEGKARILETEVERKQIMPRFIERLGVGDDILEEANDSSGHQFYKVEVENWYAFGKFGDEKADKYKLPWNGGKK